MKTFIYLICSLWLSFAVHAAELKFEPATPIVEVGKEISLTVSGTTGQITWSAQKGWIVGIGNQVTYKAPDQAGFDVVLVSDAEGNIGTVKIQIVAKSNISQENAVWEIFTNRNNIQALLLSEDNKTLWVGTEGGLEKRDAQTGKIQQVLLNTDGLPSNVTRSLLSDGQGGLWIGTYEGLAHYPASGEWQVFNEENSGLPSDVVDSLLSDGQGGLWIGTRLGGLAHYTTSGDWQVFNQENSGLPSNFINSLLSDGQGGLWIGTNKGLAHYTASGDWQVFNEENSGLPSNYIESLLSDGQGGLWTGTGGGLAHYTASGEWQVFNQENSGLPDSHVTSLLGDDQGGLWIGTYGGGLAHYTASREWQVFNDENSSLPDNDVLSLLSDGQGGLWIGTVDSGLAHYTASGEWQVFNEAKNSGLPANGVYSLLSDGQGGLWIGTGDGLAHYTASGEWQVFNKENSGLPDNEVNSLLSDGQGGLWTGTGGGLAHYTASGEWQVFNQENSGLPSNFINSLLSDGQGGLWIETRTINNNEDVLVHYPASGEWQVFNQKNSGLPSNYIESLLSDGQGGLWIGTLYGLAHYTASGEWQVFNQENSGLPDNHVWSLLSDGQGGLWTGTGGGLARYTASGEWQVFNQENLGLPDNDVLSLLSDGQGGLWTGTWGLAHLTFPEKQTGNRAAIIIAAGGNHQENTLWDATESITTYIYKMFAARKFVNEEIYYLSSEVGADFNGDGRDDHIIDAPRPQRPLILDDIRQAFTWAKQRGKLDQPLYVFFMDHGGTEKLLLNKTEYMEAIQLKEILDDYQSTTGSQIVLVIEACYSGSLLPILKAPNRAILTSASANEVANIVEKQGFTRFLTKYLLSGSNFLESYQLAQRDQTKLLGKLTQRTVAASGAEVTQGGQSPQVDDNGDGIYDATQDGQWLKQLKINGDLQTADFTLAVENLTPSSAISVGQKLQLKAKVITVKGNVERVWAIIRPPRMNSVLDTNGTPILAYPRESLFSSKDEKDTWQVTWNNIIYNGEYEITFYAEDNEKNIASSEQDTILTVSGGIEPPAKAQVQIHLDKTRYQRGEAFKATLTEDLGWGYDLYAAVVMPDENYFTLKNTNELRAVKEAKPWYAQRKQSQSVTLLDLTLPTDLPTGQYCIYGILSPEQNDVFEAMNQNLWVYGQQCFELF